MKCCLLVTAVAASLLFTPASWSDGPSDYWPVGTVIHSLLPEPDFQEEMGTEWVLLDGRPLARTDELSTFLDGFQGPAGNILLPDAQGKFLRMMDYRNRSQRDVDGDPEVNRIPGGYQSDLFQGHHHEAYARDDAGTGGVGSIGPLNRRSVGTGAVVSDGIGGAITDGTSGTPRSGSETRVRNIAVNLFVKVRKCRSIECR